MGEEEKSVPLTQARGWTEDEIGQEYEATSRKVFCVCAHIGSLAGSISPFSTLALTLCWWCSLLLARLIGIFWLTFHLCAFAPFFQQAF